MVKDKVGIEVWEEKDGMERLESILSWKRLVAVNGFWHLCQRSEVLCLGAQALLVKVELDFTEIGNGAMRMEKSICSVHKQTNRPIKIYYTAKEFGPK